MAMELRCVRCVMENPRGDFAYLAEYLFNGTSLCARHIRGAIQGAAEEGAE